MVLLAKKDGKSRRRISESEKGKFLAQGWTIMDASGEVIATPEKKKATAKKVVRSAVTAEKSDTETAATATESV